MDRAAAQLADRERLNSRLIELWEHTGDDALRRLGEGMPPRDGEEPLSEGDRTDWISTCLMSCFKRTEDPQVFACLFELNHDAFLAAVTAKVRRAVPAVDPEDVIQEVFLNIYRYPHRFMAEKADSFRNWGHRIVRNTLLKFIKSESRSARNPSLDEEQVQREDVSARSPFHQVEQAESARLVDRAYLIYLNIYLAQFLELSPKEQRALTLVEVRGASYKEAADALGIRLENLKMVIFRGRRKILRGMTQTLDTLNSLDLSASRSLCPINEDVRQG